MTSLLIVALFSIILALTAWVTVWFFRNKPRGLSSVILTSIAALILLPAATVWLPQSGAAEGQVRISPGNETVTPPSQSDSAIVSNSPSVLAPLDGSQATQHPTSGPSSKAIPDSPAKTELPPAPSSPTHIANSSAKNTISTTANHPIVNAASATAEKPSKLPLLIPDWATRLWPYFKAIWALGAFLLALRWMLQLLTHRLSCRQHIPLTDKNLLRQYHAIAHDFDLKNVPSIFTSDDPTPYCYGIFRPRLVIPNHTLAESSPAEISMIFRHELQHVRQYDLPLLALQLPVRIFYWWNPLVTRLMKHLDYARETLCDQTASQESPQLYARLLLNLASQPTPTTPTAAAMASPFKTTKSRIHSLYQPARRDRSSSGVICATVSITLAALLLSHVQIATATPAQEPVQAEPTTKKTDPKPLTPAQAIQQILMAPAETRTQIAAELNTPNNPVTPHHQASLKAMQSAKQFIAQGRGENHPKVLAETRRSEKEAKLADQAVFKLLANLQNTPPQPANQPAAPEKKQPTEASVTQFYPQYLKKLRSLPAHQQISYATSIPIPYNPAHSHWMEEQRMKTELSMVLSSGLARKHPRVLQLNSSLDHHRTTTQKAVIQQIIKALEGKTTPSLVTQEITALKLESGRLLASGLGQKHPKVLALKYRIQELTDKQK